MEVWGVCRIRNSTTNRGIFNHSLWFKGKLWMRKGNEWPWWTAVPTKKGVLNCVFVGKVMFLINRNCFFLKDCTYLKMIKHPTFYSFGRHQQKQHLSFLLILSALRLPPLCQNIWSPVSLPELKGITTSVGSDWLTFQQEMLTNKHKEKQNHKMFCFSVSRGPLSHNLSMAVNKFQLFIDIISH